MGEKILFGMYRLWTYKHRILASEIGMTGADFACMSVERFCAQLYFGDF